MRKQVVPFLLGALGVFEAVGDPVKMENDRVMVSVGGDVVSSYVWRGVYQSGFSLQPNLGLTYKGFLIGAWGSTDLGNFKEIDLSVTYEVHGFSVGVTDYWWSGQYLADSRFAPYFNYGDSHYFEATVAYEFGPKCPIGLSWSTMFAGADKKANGKQAFSSYVELFYSFHAGSVDLNASIGAAPWAAPAWLPGGYDGFQVSNVSLKATKAIPVSAKYEIPVFAQLAVNPQLNYVNFIVGISF